MSIFLLAGVVGFYYGGKEIKHCVNEKEIMDLNKLNNTHRKENVELKKKIANSKADQEAKAKKIEEVEEKNKELKTDQEAKAKNFEELKEKYRVLKTDRKGRQDAVAAKVRDTMRDAYANGAGICSCCIEDLVAGEGQVVVANPCGHHFHGSCFDSWKRKCREERKPVTCPKCRSNGEPVTPIPCYFDHEP